MGLGAIEDERHVLELLLLVELLHLRQHAALHQACAYHEDGEVGKLLVDRGIGHHLDRRTVEEHIVVLGAHLADELFEERREEQLGRVGRNGADGQHVEVLPHPTLLATTDDLADVGDAAVEVVAESLLGALHQFGDRAAAQVAVDEQHALLLDSERLGHIGRKETFTRARVERGEDKYFLFGAGTYGKLEVGTQHAERLVDEVALARLHHHTAFLLLFLPEL